ncbi:MAG: arylsulfatase, partial [Lentisphaerae bacterium]
MARFHLAHTLPAACLALNSAMAQPAPARPNIIIIMTDDAGYSDIGCFGGEIPTPNIDRLAANGLRLSHFYNNARCSPTRASLLTGQYPHRVGAGDLCHWPWAAPFPGYYGHVSLNAVTLADVLARAGYQVLLLDKAVFP